jgi:PhnB protein
MARPLPSGYHTVMSYLIVRDGARAIEFYEQAFGAEERLRLPGPDGKLGHAELCIGDSVFMLADEYPDMGALSPQTLGGAGMSFILYVDDCDAVFERAVQAGGEIVRPVADQFYGDRSGIVKDPFGHQWSVATHLEDLDMDELMRRMEGMTKS